MKLTYFPGTEGTHFAGKPITISEMWKAGYRQHPITKEWLPCNEVIAAVEALKNAKKK